MSGGLKFQIKEVEGLYYPCSENKGADQLGGYREADLRLCFRICKKPVFSIRGSYSKSGVNRGINYFLIFALKHRLWVLTCTHYICFEQKYHNFSSEIYHFYRRQNCSVLHRCIIVMSWTSALRLDYFLFVYISTCIITETSLQISTKNIVK